jgi:phage gp46-like protein
MAGRDRKLDPGTGDYVADGRGGYETTTTAETALYHQIQGELGRWWGDAAAGSRLYELDRAKSHARITRTALEDRLREALAPLFEAGRITEVSVQASRDRDRASFEVTCRDGQRGELLDLTDLLAQVT